MDKRLLDAIANADRTNRLLEEAGGTRALALQMAEASRAAKIFEAAGGNDRLALLATGRDPDWMRAHKAFTENFAAVEAARKFMQPSAIELAAQGHALSIVNQAHVLGLPELSVARFAEFDAISKAAQGIAAAMQPERSVLHDMSRHMAEISEAHRHWTEQYKWANDLERRMGLINADWARIDRLAVSGLSFAELARFSDVVRYDTPFSDETIEAVFEELGDVVEVLDDDPDQREAQYDAAGRKGALIAFPEPSYDRVIVAAGFAQFPEAPVPQPIRNAPTVLVMEDVHRAAMTHLENHLRHFIALRLADADANWLKSRVPGSVRERLQPRQDEAIAKGWPVYDLIYYGDIGDLGEIMKQSNNWTLFEPCFGSRDGLLVSISRLKPIRNHLAHGRPITQTDVLIIAAEGHLLLRAMGVVNLQ